LSTITRWTADCFKQCYQLFIHPWLVNSPWQWISKMLQAFYQVITLVHSVFRYLQQIKLVTNKFFGLSLIIFTPLYLVSNRPCLFSRRWQWSSRHRITSFRWRRVAAENSDTGFKSAPVESRLLSAQTVLHGVSFVSFIKYWKRQVSDTEVSFAPVVSVVYLCEYSVTGKAKKRGDYGCDGP
jgi:hypothetical protein